MARNRNKNYRKQVRMQILPGWLTLLVLSAAGLGFAYLWLGARCDDLGRRIKVLEREKVAARRLVVNEEFKWSNLTTFEHISRLLKKHEVAMDWPRQQAVVRLRRPAGEQTLAQINERPGIARN